jgi:hypothetical protein
MCPTLMLPGVSQRKAALSESCPGSSSTWASLCLNTVNTVLPELSSKEKVVPSRT